MFIVEMKCRGEPQYLVNSWEDSWTWSKIRDFAKRYETEGAAKKAVEKHPGVVQVVPA